MKKYDDRKYMTVVFDRAEVDEHMKLKRVPEGGDYECFLAWMTASFACVKLSENEFYVLKDRSTDEINYITDEVKFIGHKLGEQP